MAIELIFATRNPGKLRELRALVSDLDVRCHALEEHPGVPEVEETGATFLENAVLKALAAHEHTGLVALADDSGLCVEALGGAPGVRSARYGGVEGDTRRNNEKLLRELVAFPDPAQRRAWFQATLALVGPRAVLGPDGVASELRPDFLPEHLSLQAFVGRSYGRILDAARGDGGFGYDPLFWNEEHGRTFAELPLDVKNQLSHRGRAFAALREFLQGR